ncbi:hypothetical protein BACCIP111895_01455 [Neobacillus rhizosphaerae]|uniref:DNA mismatch repair protein MutT n=1 Tax=Neobacillus rhizosphaerae TaxID=2880965 RepID=A0ABM9ENW8_9BACI|nr:hypothetical protein [Neobacillus rhizosphaerae]CAH2714294.1 hypothetical protein BACCIP111895_01455 [Neobacillus rhizosphaerae]
MDLNNKRYTSAGTDIAEVKRLNDQSGLSYNAVKKLLGKQYLKSKN